MVICSSEISHLGSYPRSSPASLSIFILIHEFYKYQFTRKLYLPVVTKILHHHHSITYILFFYWAEIGTCLSALGFRLSNIALYWLHCTLHSRSYLLRLCMNWSCVGRGKYLTNPTVEQYLRHRHAENATRPLPFCIDILPLSLCFRSAVSY